MTLKISLLGPFEAMAEDTPVAIPSRRSRALLAMLALSPSRCVTRDGAAALLWPDRAEAQARASLRQELSTLKRALDPGSEAILAARNDRIELCPDAPVAFDVWWEGDLPPAPRGPLLEDVDLRSDPFEDWRRHQNAMILARISAALEAGIGAAAGAGDWDRAMALCDRLLEADPLNETAVAGKMRAALARGRKPEALALYRDHAERLAADLSAEPGAALRAVMAEAEGVPAAAPAPGPGIFERPAVLLFSFETLSRDDEDRLFADGLADDLRTTLSYWRWFPVIGPEAIGWRTARDGDLREIAAEVDAAYAVSGSVRRAGERVRITAVLTDARSGRAIWSETFDGTMGDIFALQEEVSRSIVARLEPQLGRAEAERIALARPADPTGWQLVAEADEIDRKGGEGYGTRESNDAQLPLLQAAIRAQPDYARAWSRLAKVHWRRFIMGWAESREDAMAASAESSSRAIEIDPQDWEAHAYQGLVRIFGMRDYDAGRFHTLESVRLNPSATLARHGAGCALEWMGDHGEALEHLTLIFRLNPRHPNRAAVLGDITTCHMYAGRMDEAVEAARQLMAIAPGYSRGIQRCLATFGAAGQADLAAQALSLLEEAQPDFSEDYVRETYPFARPEDLETFLEALRKGGWSPG